MRQISCPLICTILIATIFSTTINAQSSLGKESLRGLKGVYVLVEDFAPEVEKAGLWKSQMQTDAELRLRKAGIRVATADESLSNYDYCQLYINVATNPLKGKSEGLFAFDITIEVDQMVRLARRGAAGLPMMASTYQVAGSVGTVGVDHLRDDLRGAINDRIDTFLNDYLAANPKP